MARKRSYGRPWWYLIIKDDHDLQAARDLGYKPRAERLQGKNVVIADKVADPLIAWQKIVELNNRSNAYRVPPKNRHATPLHPQAT